LTWLVATSTSWIHPPSWGMRASLHSLCGCSTPHGGEGAFPSHYVRVGIAEVHTSLRVCAHEEAAPWAASSASVGPWPSKGRASGGSREGGLGLLGDASEGLRLADGEGSEDLAVELDASPVEAIDEAPVRQTVLASGLGDAAGP